MKMAVKAEGVLIPKRMLKGVKEVEIRKEKGCVVVAPVSTIDDPLFELGTHPVKGGVADGALLHDAYLYKGK